jgi:hypothetical protein
MASFAERYRDAYASLGHELKSRDGLPEDRLESAEGRLGVRLPDALREYFLVAGKERRFNQGNSRLLAPDDWFIDRRRVAFMAENQGVSFWGVQATAESAADPPVFQGGGGRHELLVAPRARPVQCVPAVHAGLQRDPRRRDAVHRGRPGAQAVHRGARTGLAVRRPDEQDAGLCPPRPSFLLHPREPEPTRPPWDRGARRGAGLGGRDNEARAQ